MDTDPDAKPGTNSEQSEVVVIAGAGSVGTGRSPPLRRRTVQAEAYALWDEAVEYLRVAPSPLTERVGIP